MPGRHRRTPEHRYTRQAHHRWLLDPAPGPAARTILLCVCPTDVRNSNGCQVSGGGGTPSARQQRSSGSMRDHKRGGGGTPSARQQRSSGSGRNHKRSPNPEQARSRGFVRGGGGTPSARQQRSSGSGRDHKRSPNPEQARSRGFVRGGGGTPSARQGGPPPRFRPRPQTKPQPRASSEPGLRTRWRWDSNPRWSCPHTRFRGVLLWPLGHATADNDTGVPRRPAGQDLSRSSMRACRVGRCCKAARTARCRPSSRYRSPSHRTTCAKRSP